MQSKQNSNCVQQQTQQIIPAQAPPSLPQTVQQVNRTDVVWKCRMESITPSKHTHTHIHTGTCNLTEYWHILCTEYWNWMHRQIYVCMFQFHGYQRALDTFWHGIHSQNNHIPIVMQPCWVVSFTSSKQNSCVLGKGWPPKYWNLFSLSRKSPWKLIYL
jgi:hypothetical protein